MGGKTRTSIPQEEFPELPSKNGQPSSTSGDDFDFPVLKKKEPGGSSLKNGAANGSQSTFPLTSPSPSPEAPTKEQRHEQVANADATSLVDSYSKTKTALKAKAETSPLIQDQLAFNHFEQSREGKTGSIIDDVINKGKFNTDDINYLAKAAPKAAKQLVKTFVPDAKPGEELSPENLNKMAANGQKPISDLIINQKIAGNQQKDADVKGFLAQNGVDPAKMVDPLYLTHVASDVQAKKQTELATLESKYPIRKVQKVSGRTGYYVDERQNRAEYEKEKAAINQKYNDINNQIGVSHANDYAKNNPTADPKTVGAEWYKYADPDAYKLWEKNGKKGPIDHDVVQTGINALYGSGKPGTAQIAAKDEEGIDDQYPDQAIAETYHRLGAELYKGENWFLNAAPSIEKLDEAALQLPQKYRDVYLKHIRESERKTVGTNVPMSGFLNKVGEGFGSTALETGKFIGDITGLRSKQDQISEAVNEPTDTRFQDVGAYNPSVQRLAQLNGKAKLTPDEIHEKQDLETYTNVRSGPQTLLDGTGNLTGQVLFQALATKGLAAPLEGLVKAAGLLKAETLVAGLGAEESIAADAVNFGVSKNLLTNVSADAIAYGSSFDGAARDAYRLMPDEKDSGNRVIYSNIVAWLNAATERIFKDEKVLDAFNADISPNIAALTKKLTSGEISKEALGSEISKVLKNSGSFVKHAVVENTKESVEEVASSLGTSLATAILVPSKFNATDAFNDATSTFTSMFTNGGLIAAMSGLNSHRASHAGIPVFSKFGVDERFTENVKSFINAQVANGNFTPAEANNKFGIIAAASNINKTVIPQVKQITNLSERAQGKYGMQLLNEHILKTQAENTGDAVLKGELEKKVKESEEIRRALVNKEVFVDGNYRVRTLEQMHNDPPQGLVIPEGFERDENGVLKQKNVRSNEEIEAEVKKTIPESVARAATKEIQQMHEDDKFPPAVSSIERQEAVKHPLQFLKSIADQARTTDNIVGTNLNTRDGAVNYYGEDLVSMAEEIFPNHPNIGSAIIKDASEKGNEEIKRTMDAYTAEGKTEEGVDHLKERALEAPNDLKKDLGMHKNLTVDIIAQNSPVEINDAILKLQDEKDKENEKAAEVKDAGKIADIDKHIALLHQGLEKAHEKLKSFSNSPEQEIEKKENFVSKNSKSISELNSKELYEHAKTLKDNQKNQEIEFFGEEGAKKYRSAQSVSNSRMASAEEVKKANRTIKEMEDSLTKKQHDDFFGIGQEGFNDPEEVRRVASMVHLVEQSEDINELSKALKIPLLEFARNKTDESAHAILNAAKRKSEELGIDTKELIQKSVENIAKDLPDKQDATFLAKKVIESLVKPEKQKLVSDKQSSDTGKSLTETQKKLSDKLKERLKLTGTESILPMASDFNLKHKISLSDLGIKEGDTFKSIVERMADYKGEFEPLLKVIKTLAGTEDIKVREATPADFEKYGAGFQGGYVRINDNPLAREEDKGTLVINPKATNQYYALTHEIMHWLTLDNFKISEIADKQKLNTLEDIYNILNKEYRGDKSNFATYGLTNFREFLAEVMINPKLREEVNGIVAKDFDNFKTKANLSKDVKSFGQIIRDLINSIIDKIFGRNEVQKALDFNKPLIENAAKIAKEIFLNPNQKGESASIRGDSETLAALNDADRKNVQEFIDDEIKNGSSVDDIKAALSDNGFSDQDINSFFPKPKPIVRVTVPQETENRSFSERIAEGTELLPKARAGIEKTMEYVQHTNYLSAKESELILDRLGEDQAFDLVTQNDKLKPAVRVVLGQAVIKKYNDLAAKAPDQATQDYYIDKTIAAANFVSEKLGTEAGQMIQAFSLWDRLTPEAQLRSAIKDAKNEGDKKIAKRQKDINVIGDKFQQVNKETADEITKSKRVKNSIAKTDSERAKKVKEKIQKARDDREKIIKKYKGDKGKNLFSAVPGLTTEGIEFVGNLAATYVREGVANIELIADKIIQHLKEVSGKDPNDEVTKNVNSIVSEKISEAKYQKNAESTKGLGALEKKIGEIINEHYTIPDKDKKALVDKFVEEAGLDKEDAAKLAQDISEEFDRIATRKKEKILYDEKARYDKIHKKLAGDKPKEKKSVQDEMIRYSNLGALDNDQLSDMIADKLGTGKLTAEQAKKITELAKKIATAPEGAPKREATEDLLAYRANIKKTAWGEVIQGVWYANVLSGYGTHLKNIVSTAFNGMAYYGAEAMLHPMEIPALTVGGAKGLARGLVEAWHTVTTGRTPIHVSKVETPDILERRKFVGGYLNPYNYLKFVGRLMKAEDVVQFQGLKEMRATQLAYREVAKQGYGNPFSKQTWGKINDTLLNTKDRLDDAEKQVADEGLKGTEKTRRIYELMEQSRPIQMTESAYGFAAHGTFNHDTEGTLGALTNLISHALDFNVSGVRPLRFFVPFTRIITNVLNTGLDFSPIGFIRAARGQRGFESYENYRYTKGQGVYKEMTKEERQQAIARASLGVGLTAALYALTKMPCGDDKHPCVEITGPGTGDYKKDAQLKQSGWQPYSIKFGDKYWSYKLTPMFINLAYLGNMNDHEKYNTHAADETLLEKAVLAGFQSGKQMADMTWISSASSLMSAFNESNPSTIGKKIQSTLVNSGKGLIIPNAYTQTAQKVEDIWGMPQKEAHGVFQQLIQDIPIARNRLNDKINALGDPIVRDTDLIESPAKHDPIWDFLLEKKGWVAPVNKNSLIIFDAKTKADRPATDDEYYQFSKMRGANIKEQIKELMENGASLNGDDNVTANEDEAISSKPASELTSKELRSLLKSFSTKATKQTKAELFADKSDSDEE